MNDPRLVEINLLSQIEQGTYLGKDFQYSKPRDFGADEKQVEEALFHLILDGAVINQEGYVRTWSNRHPPADRPTPTFPLDMATVRTINNFFNQPIVFLQITQRGRLRLYRLRDEILNRDRVREDFGILWSHRHWLPDLEVKLRFREHGQAFSVLVLDVDGLKRLNTIYSHDGANIVLRGIFEILQDAVKPCEAYRLGGDEAGAILPEIEKDMACRMAEDIRTTVERTFKDKDLGGGTTPTVTLAVGTTIEEISGSEFYSQVDHLLTEKKDRGGLRNTVHSLIVKNPGRA